MDATPGRATRIAYLSYSSGEYDARTLRMARSAIEAGCDVTVYARWHPGLPPVEQRDGYRLIRAPWDWQLAVPGLRGRARRRGAAAMAEAAARADAAKPALGDGDRDDPTAEPRADSNVVAEFPRRVAAGIKRRLMRPVRRWLRIILAFPLRPMGWAQALDEVAEPADIWHGMWAGSLPALARLRRRHGGRTIYDSRDVYMRSRDFAKIGGPVKVLIEWLERHWAHGADRVLTVNEPYADLLATQLRIPRPPVVMNCPLTWEPPVPAPNLIREALGLGPDIAVVIYQGQLTSERGIEQAMDAILDVPDAVLGLLGFGGWLDRLTEQVALPPYLGRVFLLPAVPPDELLDWTASADVAVMAIQPTTENHRYTTPQKLFESMSAGVPVVASDLPGMADIIRPERIGLVCDPSAPAAIAAAIRQLVSAPPAERAAMRAHVRAVAHDRYNWAAQLGPLFEVYRDLTPAAARPPEVASSVATPTATAPADLGPTLRFEPTAVGEPPIGTTVVVLDTTWTPDPARVSPRVIGLRDVVERIMTERDLIAESAVLLDDWADAIGVVGSMTLDGVSFWYGSRLRHWMWLVDQVLWLAVVDALLAEVSGVRTIDCAPETDEGLLSAARLIAARDGLTLREPAGAARPAATSQATAMASGKAKATKRRSLLGKVRWRIWPPEPERRRRWIGRRAKTLASDPAPRLLVVQAHARQRIDTPRGPRFINPYLAPIMDRLAGSALDPFEVDIRSEVADDETWARLRSGSSERTLPSDILTILSPALRTASAKADVEPQLAGLDRASAPLVVYGVDLGATLGARVGARARVTLPKSLLDVSRIRTLLRLMHPAGVLLADEYHRQDWLAAAAAEGIPTAAVQHGVIYRWHTGYVHRSRPPELRLPDRTYVFGSWERDLLTTVSAYRADEVRVGGSPRLDLVAPGPDDRDAVRRELGVADGDRLVVLSGTWGPMYRRFHYPIALAHLFDHPLDRLHVVVKLHPAERDEGPYRRIIDGVAAAHGFEPPPISIVQSIDLYRLLAAADAHLGVHSTLLTEAVATGTPNLLAAGLAASDLLGYVAAGVAIPVREAADLAAALDRPRDAIMAPADREAFLRAHFEPGDASARIGDDLLEWMR